jgi:NADH dehydrogenase [ubiquinone] 1 alpha subcomplex assembly factor 1
MMALITPIMEALLIPLIVSGMMLFDFSQQSDIKDWRIINDGVMGGLSRSEFEATKDSTAVFRGVLSLENYGGFASVRSGISKYDLGDYDGIELRIMGDGRRYQIRVRTDSGYDGVAYKYEFDTAKDTWATIRAPFAEFVATFRGRIVKDYPLLDTAKIRQIGFLIADGQEGTFRLEIDSIGTYSLSDKP